METDVLRFHHAPRCSRCCSVNRPESFKGCWKLPIHPIVSSPSVLKNHRHVAILDSWLLSHLLYLKLKWKCYWGKTRKKFLPREFLASPRFKEKEIFLVALSGDMGLPWKAVLSICMYVVFFECLQKPRVTETEKTAKRM